MVNTTNKVDTGDFKYKLFLPKAIQNQEAEFDKLSLINLKPIRMNPFADECGVYCAYAPIGDAKVLLLSASRNQKNLLQCDLIETKGQRKLLEQQKLDLGEELDFNHLLGLVL